MKYIIPQGINPIPNSFKNVNTVRILSTNGRFIMINPQKINCKMSKAIA